MKAAGSFRVERRSRRSDYSHGLNPGVGATVEATYMPDVNVSEADATIDQPPNVALKLTNDRWIARASHVRLLTRSQLTVGVRRHTV
jgi:hypothetical protein